MKSSLSRQITVAAGFLVTPTTQQYIGSDHGVSFEYPVTGLTLNYMDSINVTYESPFSSPLLYTFCGDSVQKRVDEVNPYNSSALISLNWDGDETPCYFDLRPNTTAGYGANSNKFAYNSTERSTQTTAGLPTPTSTTTSASSTSASSASSTAVTTSSAAAPTQSSHVSSPSNDLSTGAAAGIGIGVGLVGIGLGTAVAILLLRRRKGNRRTAASTHPSNLSSPPTSGYAHLPSYSAVNYDRPSHSPGLAADLHKQQSYSPQPWPQEMDSNYQPPELSSEQGLYELHSTPR
ncbi:hypothetical protein F5Y16DRAFT_367362 [Xylariaceae sp. FL0255]|nr:hypothetical protein F5Y16DRAFT_367362 [Xylariaceae sp. FL0255]